MRSPRSFLHDFLHDSSGPRRVAALLTAAVFTALLAAPASASADRWLHVKVDEADGAKVNVNLPLNLIEMAFDMIPEDVSHDLDQEVRVELNEAGFDLDELRALWFELRDGEDATFVTVEDGDTTVAVRKVGDYFVAETVDSVDSRVDVRFPAAVVDALFSGGDRLDFAAAVRALADHSDGDMVTVRDRGTSVRVWIDDVNEGR